MNHPRLPELICEPLPNFDLEDWEEISRVFHGRPGWRLQQTWLPTPAANLAHAICKAGTWAESLVVFAEIQDRDIFNPVHKFNAFAFTKGDAFEMFLRPEGQESYFEFHVTPHNQKLQLRFESADWFRSIRRGENKAALKNYKVQRPLFDSRTRVCSESGQWYVVASIPFKSVVENGNPASLSRWKFSASRYDYTRGHRKPVLSSTSAHAVCDFHRQEEWGVLILPPPRPVTAQIEQVAVH